MLVRLVAISLLTLCAGATPSVVEERVTSR